MAGRTYGISIFRKGVQLRSDGRPRRHLVGGYSFILKPRKSAHFRGKVRGWSERSARRLRFITHNADVFFRSLVTLTYHALAETWETNAERNRRVFESSAADRHRFLRCLADASPSPLDFARDAGQCAAQDAGRSWASLDGRIPEKSASSLVART